MLASTGMAMAMLGAVLHLVELRTATGRGAARFGRARLFEVFGRNALFVFVLSGLLPRILALARWPDGTGACRVAFAHPRKGCQCRWVRR